MRKAGFHESVDTVITIRKEIPVPIAGDLYDVGARVDAHAYDKRSLRILLAPVEPHHLERRIDTTDCDCLLGLIKVYGQCRRLPVRKTEPDRFKVVCDPAWSWRYEIGLR
jgi:hypothetical protein